MGSSKKHQLDQIRPPLKDINTTPKEQNVDDEKEQSTTPTGREARIPVRLPCPPAPRKPRPSASCNYDGVREFFIPPDLETVFKCHVEKAS